MKGSKFFEVLSDLSAKTNISLNKVVILFFIFSRHHMVFKMGNLQESFTRDDRLDRGIYKRVFLRDERFSLNIIRGFSRLVGMEIGLFFSFRDERLFLA